MPYKDEVIVFGGGMTAYIGKLDQNPHPMGKGWIRINDPCTFEQAWDEQQHKYRVSMVRIWGVDNLYRRFVDIYCPPDSLKEIRVTDKKGGMYKKYKEEVNRPSMNLIRPPTDGDVRTITKQ